MINNYKELIRTDLVRAQILKESEGFNFIKFLFLFVRSKRCRVHTLIRMRSANPFVSLIAKIWLDQFFIEVGQNTVIGKYFKMPHPRCIIIANHVIIGDYVSVGQYVTIGGNFRKTKLIKNGNIQKLPILGNKININPGAVIGGPVTLGDEIIVGANAVVTHDVASNTIIYGQNQISKKKIKIVDAGGSYSEINK